MKIATIIVTYNDLDNTKRFVQTIQKYDLIDRIVVVDNMSTTIGVFEKLKNLENDKVKVIQSEKNGGYNYGNNFGIKFLDNLNEEYDYIIISNPDIEVTESAINHCIKVAEENEEVAIIAPRMFNKENLPIRRSAWKMRTFARDVVHSTRLFEILFFKIFRDGEYSEEDYKNEILEVEAISGAFFIIKYKVLKQINLFDENTFLFYEEDILAKKMQELNYKTISLNQEKFIHYESQTIGKTLSYYKKVEQLYKSKLYYHKNYNNINTFQVTIFGILNIFRKVELLIEIPIRKMIENIL